MSYDPIHFPKKIPVNSLGTQSSDNIFTDLVAPNQDVNFIALVGFRRTGKSLFAETLKNRNTSVYVYEDLDIIDGRKHIEPIVESYKRSWAGVTPRHVIVIFRSYWTIPKGLKQLITQYIIFGTTRCVHEVRYSIYTDYFQSDKTATDEYGFTIPEHQFSAYDPLVMVDISANKSYHNNSHFN